MVNPIYFVNISVFYMRYKIYVSESQGAKVLPGFNKFLAIFSNNDLCREIIRFQGFFDG